MAEVTSRSPDWHALYEIAAAQDGYFTTEQAAAAGYSPQLLAHHLAARRVVRARRGVYREASFRAMPLQHLRYFDDTAEGRSVRPEVRAMCHFGHLNLLEHGRTAIVGAVDVIFCRNVLIYFDPESRAQVVRTFFDRLVPGGYLLLGHSESLLRTTTDFELVHLRTDMVYRRPIHSEAG